MNKNVGTADRTIRVIVGLAILSLYFFLHGNARWVALIGIIPLMTAIFSFCPCYSMIGVNTCSRRSK